MPTERGLNKHRGRKTKEQKWRETDERYREIGKGKIQKGKIPCKMQDRVQFNVISRTEKKKNI